MNKPRCTEQFSSDLYTGQIYLCRSPMEKLKHEKEVKFDPLLEISFCLQIRNNKKVYIQKMQGVQIGDDFTPTDSKKRAAVRKKKLKKARSIKKYGAHIKEKMQCPVRK